jgi:hypothetical protein
VSYTVRITDDTSGEVITEIHVTHDLETATGTNYENAVGAGRIEDSVTNQILAAISPEVCPYDCEGCNG